MAQPAIQTSFASGEWAPKLRSRVDVQKYHAGAALLRNFFVDFSGGGASTRQGTKFINQCNALGSRLIPFQPSSNLSYVLEFGQNYIRFYSNGATVLSGGVPYQISTPYNASDLFPNQSTGNPGLKFVQDVTSMIICHPNYAPMILTINSATNWTLSAITFGSTILAPTGLGASSSIPAGQFDYAYLVTALDSNNQESPPSAPATLSNLDYIGSASTAGSNIITWSPVSGAVSYNVYKAIPIMNAAVTGGAQFGFIGNVTGTTFQDSYPGINPDMGQTPPVIQNPFSGASVVNLVLQSEANYTSVPSVTIAAPPSGITATGYASLAAYIGSPAPWTVSCAVNPTGITCFFHGGIVATITSASFLGGSQYSVNSVTIITGGSVTSGSVPTNPLPAIGTTGAEVDTVSGGINFTWQIGSLNLIQGGFGYVTAPSVTITGGATATATLGTASAGNPGVPGFFQQRLMLAAQQRAIQDYNLSQPGSFFNFNISNPTQSDDAISGNIISEQLNDIRWLLSVPTGVIAGTGKAAWLINGGGGLSTLNPITPSNQTASPQAFNGTNDLKPQQVNFDVIYGTNKGSYFRDLTYNIYANIYTGADISVLSNHLFFNYYFLDLAWSEEPFKTMWFVRNDGIMLSLAFVKEQDLIGWAHHDTNGLFKSVCSVIETVNGNVVDAVYVIVGRTINGAYVEYVERMADRYFPFGYEDSWSVDCALQTTPQFNYIGTGDVLTITGSNTIGGAVAGTLSQGSRGWVQGDFVRISGGVIKINATSSGASFTGNIIRPMQGVNPYTGMMWPTDNFQYWATVTTVSGLTQLEGAQVVGVADGTAIGPLTVSNTGTVTLPNPASKVTLGLAFLPQLKTLPLDLGEPTVQSKRKKLPAVTLRCADTLGLQVGTSFANAVTVKDLQIGAIPSNSNGPSIVTDLVNPSWNPDTPIIDARQILDQLWQEPGQLCVQQNLPYPATILGVMPEVAVGDTPR